MSNNIPYKIYLSEKELPTAWYNLRADLINKPAPLLNPQTRKPSTLDELSTVFCRELAAQELDETNPYIEIPEPVRNFYKMYRPAPLIRAYFLEKALNTPAHIYYKFEGNNTSGSHKLNSAIAQAYYAKQEGLKGVSTETGAGQWGTALSMASAFFGIDCRVFMVKCSYEQKPHRREVMHTYGAKVTPSPSMDTEIGRRILEEHPGTSGSLGCAISEAVEFAQGEIRKQCEAQLQFAQDCGVVREEFVNPYDTTELANMVKEIAYDKVYEAYHNFDREQRKAILDDIKKVIYTDDLNQQRVIAISEEYYITEKDLQMTYLSIFKNYINNNLNEFLMVPPELLVNIIQFSNLLFELYQI